MSESRYTDLITQRRAEKGGEGGGERKNEPRERDCGAAFALVLGPRYANEWSLSLLSSPPHFAGKHTHTHTRFFSKRWKRKEK